MLEFNGECWSDLEAFIGYGDALQPVFVACFCEHSTIPSPTHVKHMISNVKNHTAKEEDVSMKPAAHDMILMSWDTWDT